MQWLLYEFHYGKQRMEMIIGILSIVDLQLH